MSYDWYAKLATPGGAGMPLPPHEERRRLAIQIHLGDRDAAKEAVRDKLSAWGSELPEALRYQGPGDAAPLLPRAICLRFTWTLAEPFFSRAQHQFDAMDNPIVRDGLTGEPCLPASGAKGMLRHAMADFDPAPPAGVITALFGNEQGANDDFRAGHLLVGAVTYQAAAAPDILSPHERQFRVVDKPIGFETIPKGTQAAWSMQLIERQAGELDCATLLRSVLKGVDFLVGSLGLSAKRSAGFGLGEKLKVELVLGSAWRLGDALGEAVIHFSEPEPPRPREPQWHRTDWALEALVDRQAGTMRCEKSRAAQVLAEADAREIARHAPKKKINMQELLSRWSRNDQAGAEWDRFNSALNENQAGQAARQAALAAFQAWEQRRAAHLAAPQPRRHRFSAVGDALSALTQLAPREVAP